MEIYSDLITLCHFLVVPEMPKFKCRLRWVCVQAQLKPNTLLKVRRIGLRYLKQSNMDSSSSHTDTRVILVVYIVTGLPALVS